MAVTTTQHLATLQKRASQKTLVRKPYHNCKKPPPDASTLAQKKARVLKRLKRDKEFTKILEDTKDYIWKVAQELREKFGKNTATYYYRLIMQQSRLVSKHRRVNKWNAWLSQEVKQRNAGMF